MRPDTLATVDSIVIDEDDEYNEQITVTFKMSQVLVRDFTEYTPPDMENDTAQEFGKALLQEISIMLKNMRA